MIKEVSGDILLSQAQAMAHGIAPHDHFNQGLAMALREHFPAMARDFRHYCHQQNPKPGSAWLWAGAEGKIIINLMVQEPPKDENSHPGKAKEKYIHSALKDLRKIIEEENISSLALPRLATGVGGLDWADVAPLIHQTLGDLDIPVFVYTTYHKGEKAKESLKAA
ncbi:MAG: macro domain-containing protein [Rhodospirillales bacterium]|nr:macro domain-containing protein [Alphaproteobacteria bacterium]USO02917.1 MAG: macro domain-containing protein [Rhodospirillales bacterium]